MKKLFIVLILITIFLIAMSVSVYAYTLADFEGLPDLHPDFGDYYFIYASLYGTICLQTQTPAYYENGTYYFSAPYYKYTWDDTNKEWMQTVYSETTDYNHTDSGWDEETVNYDVVCNSTGEVYLAQNYFGDMEINTPLDGTEYNTIPDEINITFNTAGTYYIEVLNAYGVPHDSLSVVYSDTVTVDTVPYNYTWNPFTEDDIGIRSIQVFDSPDSTTPLAVSDIQIDNYTIVTFHIDNGKVYNSINDIKDVSVSFERQYTTPAGIAVFDENDNLIYKKEVDMSYNFLNPDIPFDPPYNYSLYVKSDEVAWLEGVNYIVAYEGAVPATHMQGLKYITLTLDYSLFDIYFESSYKDGERYTYGRDLVINQHGYTGLKVYLNKSFLGSITSTSFYQSLEDIESYLKQGNNLLEFYDSSFDENDPSGIVSPVKVIKFFVEYVTFEDYWNSHTTGGEISSDLDLDSSSVGEQILSLVGSITSIIPAVSLLFSSAISILPLEWRIFATFSFGLGLILFIIRVVRG